MLTRQFWHTSSTLLKDVLRFSYILIFSYIVINHPCYAAQPAYTTPASPLTLPPTLAKATQVTVDQLVAIALQNNSSLILARQRLQKAAEDIAQVDAQGRPQLSAGFTDTLSTVRGYQTTGGASVPNPSLPGGGTIPIITDVGGGNNASVTAGGGGGTTSSTGSESTSTTSASNSGATGLGAVGASSGQGGLTSSANGQSSLITNSTSGGTSLLSGSNSNSTLTGSTSAAGFGTTGATAGAAAHSVERGNSSRPNDMPAIDNTFAAALNSGAAVSSQRQAHQTTSGSASTSNSQSSGQYNNNSERISLSQYVDIFGLLGTARSVEEYTRQFYLLDLDRLTNETALNVKNLFYSLLRAQDLVSVYQEQVDYAQENVQITQAQFTNGLVAEYSVLAAKTQLSNAQQTLISARNNFDLTRANLNNLLGIRLDSELELIPSNIPEIQQELNLNQAILIALANRPEIKQAKNNVTIAQKLIRLASDGLLPTFGLVGTGSYNNEAAPGTNRSTLNLSAVLNIPFDDGGLTHSRVRAAQIDLETQSITLATLQQTVELEVRQAVINITDAQAQVSSAGDGVTSAREAVRLAVIRYKNGLGTELDISNADANLATARDNLLTAQFNYQTSLAQLLRGEGGR